MPARANLTGDSYLDFLLGLSTRLLSHLQNANPINHYVNQTISAYAEDNWHVNSRLSLQYGFRYDDAASWERNNQRLQLQSGAVPAGACPGVDSTTGGSFDCQPAPGLQTNSNGTQFYLNGVDIAGQKGHRRAWSRTTTRRSCLALASRMTCSAMARPCFAAALAPSTSASRATTSTTPPARLRFISTPSANNVEFTNPSYNWQTGGTAASTPTFTQGYNSLNTYYPDPAVAQYSLGVQHEIAPALILITQYVGNLGWHQNDWMPINNFPLSTPMATRAGIWQRNAHIGAGKRRMLSLQPIPASATSACNRTRSPAATTASRLDFASRTGMV